jgi:hypothetical protein
LLWLYGEYISWVGERFNYGFVSNMAEIKLFDDNDGLIKQLQIIFTIWGVFGAFIIYFLTFIQSNIVKDMNIMNDTIGITDTTIGNVIPYGIGSILICNIIICLIIIMKLITIFEIDSIENIIKSMILFTFTLFFISFNVIYDMIILACIESMSLVVMRQCFVVIHVIIGISLVFFICYYTYKLSIFIRSISMAIISFIICMVTVIFYNNLIIQQFFIILETFYIYLGVCSIIYFIKWILLKFKLVAI